MSRPRTLAILLVLLAAQLALIAVSRVSRGDREETPILASALESKPIGKIVLGGTKRTAATLTLRRTGDDAWVIEEASDYPADGAKITGLLSRLAGAKASRPVATETSYHAALGVDDESASARLRLYAPGASDPFLDLVFGDAPGPLSSAMRHAGGDDVWEIYGLAAWELRSDAAPWMVRPFVNVDPAEVTAISITANRSTTRLELGPAGWSLVSAKGAVRVPVDRVAALIGAAAALSPTAPAGRTGGALPPGAAVEAEMRIGTKDGRELLLLFGGDPAARTVEVATPGFPFAASVWRSSVQPILGASEEKLLAR